MEGDPYDIFIRRGQAHTLARFEKGGGGKRRYRNRNAGIAPCMARVTAHPPNLDSPLSEKRGSTILLLLSYSISRIDSKLQPPPPSPPFSIQLMIHITSSYNSLPIDSRWNKFWNIPSLRLPRLDVGETTARGGASHCPSKRPSKETK